MNHIAFILDGNRRWADKQGIIKRYLGHDSGLKNVKTISRSCFNRGIKHVTFWALSTDNWKKRDNFELDNIFKLLKSALADISELTENKASFHAIGDISEFPKDVQQVIKEAEEKTKHLTEHTINIGLNYGGQDEVARAVGKLIQNCFIANPPDGEAGCELRIDQRDINKSEIRNPQLFSNKNFLTEQINSYLDTAHLPNPELIVRTGGHHRTSGFMIWQSVYSEWYFTDTLWPDFDEKELDKAIEYFNNCERKFGK